MLQASHFLAVFAALLAALSQPAPKIREITNAEPIPTQLVPDDDVVVVREAGIIITDYVYFGDESPQQEIARQVRMADGIAIVDVESVTGSLIKNDRWLLTRVGGRAVQVIKNPSLFPDGRVEFQYEGGMMRLNGVEVRAGNYPIVGPGARWLVFIHTNVTDRWLAFNVDVSNPRQLTRPRFMNVDPATSPNPFRGMSLSDAINEMKKSVQ